jgi:mono/diheme cytochrome c family protein
MRSPLPLIACLTVGALVLAAGCGGGNDSDTISQRTSAGGSPEPPAVQQPQTPAELHGRQEFIDHCGACHTLAAAGTVGQVGPNLGDIAIDETDVLKAIRRGGGRHAKGQETGPSGTMPSNLVTGKDARDVAAFVAANASGSSTP